MKHIVLLIGFICLIVNPEILIAQESDDVDSKLEEASEYLNSGEEEKSLGLYKDVLKLDENNESALWNIAIIYAQMGNREEDEESQKEMLEKAMSYADKALEHHEESGYAHYSKAVVLARKTDVLDTGDTIEASHEIKKHIEKATDKLPDFAPAWHLFGVWHSDVANVSSAESTAAGLFSDGLPDANNDKAEKYLKKALDMDPDVILFNIDIARHYLEIDEPEKAKEYFQKVVNLEPKMKDDARYKEEAKEKLSEL